MVSANWSHTHTRNSTHGDMRCTACHQQIEDGEYRYRMRAKRGDWGYVAQHRTCSEDDPIWARMDAERTEHAAHYAEFVSACREFRERWKRFGVTELDDYITELKPND